jgi:chromosome segregation ATPase
MTTITEEFITHPGVTLEAVTAAATGLQNEGKPVTIEAVREVLGAGSPYTIHQHLASWRAVHAQPAETPKAELPAALATALGEWAQQFAEQAGAGSRDAQAQADSDMAALLESYAQLEAERAEALATLAEREEVIARMTIELRNARTIATDALVSKAKDQLAIEGKDSQLADLRQQLERNVAASAAQSDARLAAEMDLVGAITARDNFAAEIEDLRAQLDASQAERRTLRTEKEVLLSRL